MKRVIKLLERAVSELDIYHENLDADKDMNEEAYSLLTLIHEIRYELRCVGDEEES